jgi:hypothetical protein
VTPVEREGLVGAATFILRSFCTAKADRFADARVKARETLLDSFEKNKAYPDWAIFLLIADKLPRNTTRDLAIVIAVEMICIEFDLPATRNRFAKSGQESACSIVAAALGRLKMSRTEAAVNKIYDKQQKRFPKKFIASFVDAYISDFQQNVGKHLVGN